MGETKLSGAFIDLKEIVTPPNPSIDTGRLYVKDVASVTTLFFRDSAGVETDLLADSAGVTSINADTTPAQIIAGTTNRISLVDAGATHTIDIDVAYVGQASITTLGTIGTGVWEATAITGANINAALADLSDVTAKTGSGTVVVMDTSPTIITPTINSFINSTHDHETTGDGGKLLSTGALSDTADIAYLNTANIFIAGNKNTFAHSATTAGLNVGPVAGNPSGQVDGDIWLNVTSQQLFARINGANVDLGATGGVSLPVVDTTSIAKGSVDATKEVRFEVDGNTTGITGVLATIFTTAKTITFPDATATLVGIGIVNQLTNTELTSGVFGKITGLGAQAQTLDMNGNTITFGSTGEVIWEAGEQIGMESTTMVFDVKTGGSFDFERNGIEIGKIANSGITIPNSGQGLILGSGVDIFISTTTGTKIGTGTTQLISFWNATPVVQPAHIADPTGGGTVDAEARTAINSILAQLATLGLQAAS